MVYSLISVDFKIFTFCIIRFPRVEGICRAQYLTKFFKDGSGYITKGELRNALKGQGVKMSPAQVNQLIKSADTDGDGKISISEFLTLYCSAQFGRQLSMSTMSKKP